MEDTQPIEDQPNRKSGPPLFGRDELNLAEFPITVLGDRVPNGCKTLTFEDEIRDKGTGEMVKRRLTVTGSDAYGLPTAADDDVIVALIQLTKRFNDFTDPKVHFSRYEVLRLLGWRDEGRSYRRLDESLKRWLGVTLYYDKAWRDKERDAWVSDNFHILERVLTLEAKDKKRLRAKGQQELAFSSFVWNEVVFRSFQAGYIKSLDIETYFSLQSAVTKRLYRYIDKHFYHRRGHYDLHMLAFEKLGMSRSYDTGQIKRLLQRSIAELEEVGFLEPMGPKERYQQVTRGKWTVTFVRKTKNSQAKEEPAELITSLPAAPPSPKSEPSGIERELTSRGVTPAMASELVASYPAEQVTRQLEHLDWLADKQPSKVTDPAAFLVEAVRRDYTLPKRFESRADREKRQAAERERRRKEVEASRKRLKEKVREDEAQAKIAAYLKGLSPEDLSRLDAQAIEKAEPTLRTNYEEEKKAVLRRMYLDCIRRTHVRRLLKLPEPPEEATA